MQLMKDEEFERTMEAWAEQEQATAPSMRPTDEMYRLVEGKRERGGLFAVDLPRWARVGATVVSVLLVALAYTQLYQPSIVVGPPESWPVAVVRVRQAFPSQDELVITRPYAGRRGGPKGQVAFFDVLDFQYRSPDEAVVTAVDLRQPLSESLALSAADSYRLAFEPAADCHVYVYQQSSAGDVEQLFPNDAYVDITNPLRQGETYYLPPLPQGFYLEADGGKQRLFVVAATEPLPELIGAYEGYVGALDEQARQQALEALLETLDGIAAAHPDQATRWTFDFTVH
jgi:hypothetical protein